MFGQIQPVKQEVSCTVILPPMRSVLWINLRSSVEREEEQGQANRKEERERHVLQDRSQLEIFKEYIFKLDRAGTGPDLNLSVDYINPLLHKRAISAGLSQKMYGPVPPLKYEMLLSNSTQGSINLYKASY